MVTEVKKIHKLLDGLSLNNKQALCGAHHLVGSVWEADDDWMKVTCQKCLMKVKKWGVRLQENELQQKRY